MSRKKILIADDSPTSIMWQKMILRDGHYDLFTAEDGQAAVEVAVRERPDLILMDVVMPRMNGFEACKVLRARPDMKAVPIIMVTTRGEMTNVEQGFQSGCTEYITKPVDRSELLAKVRTYLGESAAGRAR